MTNAIAITRGCGTRKKGGIYFETGLQPGGSPLEDFIIDPPIRVNDWNLSAVGVQLIERNGVTHIIDWVGSKFYPNVADFLEEVRGFGLSRRLSSSLAFNRLTPQSRILLVHSRAWVSNFRDFQTWHCPKSIAGHHPSIIGHEPEDHKRMCAGIWWEDIEQGIDQGDSRTVRREMPSFSYEARRRSDGVKPDYAPAIFASFPCSRIKCQGISRVATEAWRVDVVKIKQ